MFMITPKHREQITDNKIDYFTNEQFIRAPSDMKIGGKILSRKKQNHGSNDLAGRKDLNSGFVDDTLDPFDDFSPFR